MLAQLFAAFLLLPAAIRTVSASNSSIACNNSPSLCSKKYDEVAYLGAHDSPFLRDAATGWSDSGNQYYNTTVQLAAGVRLVSAQVQTTDSGALHVCHTSCELLDAGSLTDWLSEIKTWMDANPHEVVTIMLVNGADATATELASRYEAAGITTDLAYTPTGSTSEDQTWPTLKEMIDSGNRLVNFVASVSDNSAATYLIDQWTYVFENNYNNASPTEYSCEAYLPSTVTNDTSTAISDGMLPLMNHFLYEDESFGIQIPNASYVSVTNGPTGSGVGNLGSAASECDTYYGRVPVFTLVDFFNEGPAIETIDSLNNVTDPVGRLTISTSAPSESAAGKLDRPVSTAALFAALSGAVLTAMI